MFIFRRAWDVGIKYGNECTALLTLMHDVKNVARVTPKTIRSCDNQFVTLAKKLNDGCELHSALTARARLYRTITHPWA